jgi:hypothetical protein
MTLWPSPQQLSDFSGTWLNEASFNEPAQPHFPTSLKIGFQENKMTMEMADQSGKVVSKISYPRRGTEDKNTIATFEWYEERATIEVALESANAGVSTKISESWQLMDNGRKLRMSRKTVISSMPTRGIEDVSTYIRSR